MTVEKTGSSRDIDLLTALNHDYVSSVQKGDVKRFEESRRGIQRDRPSRR